MLRKPVAMLLVVLAAALVGCGDGGSDAEDRQDEAAIRKTIQSEFHDQLPAVCAAMETATMQEQVHRFLPRALKYCEGGDVEEIYVRSMRISDVAAKEETATADVSLVGGKLDGQTVTVSLVKSEGDRWAYDGVLAFKDFDRLAAIRAFGDGLTGTSWTTPERVFGNCLVNQLKPESSREVKKLVLNPAASPFDFALEICGARFSAGG